MRIDEYTDPQLVYAREPGEPVGHREYVPTSWSDARKWIKDMAPSFVEGTLLYITYKDVKGLGGAEAYLVKNGKAVSTQYVSYKDWT